MKERKKERERKKEEDREKGECAKEEVGERL
jgi:hypothetical protein